MKLIISTFVYFLFCFSVVGQKFSVSPDKMNILYLGVDNPLSITVENCSSNLIIVKTDNGKITGSNGKYLFRGSKPGKAEIIVYKKVNGKAKEVGRNYFRVKALPRPVFKIGSGRDSMPKVEIANQQYVRAELENFDIDANYDIESFTVCIIANDTCKFSIKTNSGNKISEEILNEFELLKPNDVVVFKNILIKTPGEELISLEPRIITIY